MINVYDLHVAHPEIFRQISVKDKLFLCYQCPQVDKEITLFTHLNIIVYTMQGKRVFQHSGKSWLLTDNKAAFIRKTAYKQEIYHHTIGWQVLVFYFPDEYVCNILDEYCRNAPVKNVDPPTDMLIEIDVNEITRAFFYSIVPYFTQSLQNAEDLIELKFKELLFNIFSSPRNAPLVAYVQSLRNRDISRVKEVMETNYMFNLSIAEFARMAQCSVSSFKRKFQEHYHTPPGKWLKQQRLEYARLLLTAGGKTVSEIAYDSGFENVSHFSRIFKETYGAMPSRFNAKMSQKVS